MIGSGKGTLVTRLPGYNIFYGIVFRFYYKFKIFKMKQQNIPLLTFDELDKLSDKTQRAYQQARFKEWKNDDSIPINEFDQSLDIDMEMVIQLTEYETKEYYIILNKKRQLAHELDEIITVEYKKYP